MEDEVVKAAVKVEEELEVDAVVTDEATDTVEAEDTELLPPSLLLVATVEEDVVDEEEDVVALLTLTLVTTGGVDDAALLAVEVVEDPLVVEVVKFDRFSTKLLLAA